MYHMDIYLMAISILSIFNALFCALLFLEENGTIYKLIMKKMKKEKHNIFMRDHRRAN